MSKRNREKRHHETQKVVFPKIDVVVPVYGQFETLKQALNALPAAMNELPYAIHLVDDCSPNFKDGGREFYQTLRNEIPNINSINYHSKNEGFGKTCNDGAHAGNSKYILIHSTDVILFPDAVRILHEQIENNPDIGMVAPKLLFFPNQNNPNRPAEKVQSVGLFFGADGEPYHPFVGWDNNHPMVNVVRDVNAVTGATFLIRRNIWQQLKGFSLDYSKGTFEDVDISLRLRTTGAKIRILPQAAGYHFAGLSVIGQNEGFPIDRNHDIFKAKFNNIVPYDSWWLSGYFSE